MPVNPDSVRLVNDGLARVADEDISKGEERRRGLASMFVRNLASLVTDEDDATVYDTVGSLDPEAQRLVAAQAMLELRNLGFRFDGIADPDDDDDDAEPLVFRVSEDLDALFAAIILTCPGLDAVETRHKQLGRGIRISASGLSIEIEDWRVGAYELSPTEFVINHDEVRIQLAPKHIRKGVLLASNDNGGKASDDDDDTN